MEQASARMNVSNLLFVVMLCFCFATIRSICSGSLFPTARQSQLDSVSSAFEALKEKSASSAVTNANDGFSADANAELRRLKVELDMKGSELDRALKEGAEARAELKEMKGMFNAAEAGAGAAGADETSLRKRISQLECERGLLRGEKDRFETVATAAATEKKTSAARAAAEIERLERDISELRERAEKASGAMADSDRAKMALQSMEARLSQVLEQRTDLQVSSASRQSSVSVSYTCFARRSCFLLLLPLFETLKRNGYVLELYARLR